MISGSCSRAKRASPLSCMLYGDLGREAAMTPEDRQQMIDLCHRISRETDAKKLARWIEELNGLIRIKVRELRDNQKAS